MPCFGCLGGGKKPVPQANEGDKAEVFLDAQSTTDSDFRSAVGESFSSASSTDYQQDSLRSNSILSASGSLGEASPLVPSTAVEVKHGAAILSPSALGGDAPQPGTSKSGGRDDSKALNKSVSPGSPALMVLLQSVEKIEPERKEEKWSEPAAHLATEGTRQNEVLMGTAEGRDMGSSNAPSFNSEASPPVFGHICNDANLTMAGEGSRTVRRTETSEGVFISGSDVSENPSYTEGPVKDLSNAKTSAKADAGQTGEGKKVWPGGTRALLSMAASKIFIPRSEDFPSLTCCTQPKVLDGEEEDEVDKQKSSIFLPTERFQSDAEYESAQQEQGSGNQKEEEKVNVQRTLQVKAADNGKSIGLAEAKLAVLPEGGGKMEKQEVPNFKQADSIGEKRSDVDSAVVQSASPAPRHTAGSSLTCVRIPLLKHPPLENESSQFQTNNASSLNVAVAMKPLTHCWMVMPPSAFLVRGKDYFQSGIKQPAYPQSPYTVTAIDVFSSTSPLTHVMRFIQLPATSSCSTAHDTGMKLTDKIKNNNSNIHNGNPDSDSGTTSLAPMRKSAVASFSEPLATNQRNKNESDGDKQDASQERTNGNPGHGSAEQSITSDAGNLGIPNSVGLSVTIKKHEQEEEAKDTPKGRLNLSLLLDVQKEKVRKRDTVQNAVDAAGVSEVVSQVVSEFLDSPVNKEDGTYLDVIAGWSNFRVSNESRTVSAMKAGSEHAEQPEVISAPTGAISESVESQLTKHAIQDELRSHQAAVVPSVESCPSMNGSLLSPRATVSSPVIAQRSHFSTVELPQWLVLNLQLPAPSPIPASNQGKAGAVQTTASMVFFGQFSKAFWASAPANMQGILKALKIAQELERQDVNYLPVTESLKLLIRQMPSAEINAMEEAKREEERAKAPEAAEVQLHQNHILFSGTSEMGQSYLEVDVDTSMFPPEIRSITEGDLQMHSSTIDIALVSKGSNEDESSELVLLCARLCNLDKKKFFSL